MAQVVKTFNGAGTFTFIVPSDVTSLLVEQRGGGGAGARRSTNGGGGGASGGGYSKKTVPVSPLSSHTIVNGAGATQAASPASGGDSTFDTTVVVAKGGLSVAANVATGAAAPGTGTGDVVYDGGPGANAPGDGGGGGEAGEDVANGHGGSSSTGGTGGVGGDGGGGKTTTQGPGTSGTAPGGGGGGALRVSSGTQNGGSGAPGQTIITYDSAVVFPSVRSKTADNSSLHSFDPSTRPSIAVPAGAVSGEVIKFCLYVAAPGATPLAGLSIPGFTVKIDNLNAISGKEGHNIVAWKRFAGEAGPYTANWTDNQQWEAVALCIKDCIASGDPFNVTAEGTDSTGTAIATPSVTTTVDNCTIFSTMIEDVTGAATEPPNWTEEHDASFGLHIASLQQNGQGATGAANWTGGSSNGAVANTLAVMGVPQVSTFVPKSLSGTPQYQSTIAQ